MSIQLIPHQEPDYGVMKCKPEKADTPHDSWTFHRMGHICDDEMHKSGLYIVIRRCHHCGTYTEWVQITGPDGGIFELTLLASEVTVMRVGLDNDSNPDLP